MADIEELTQGTIEGDVYGIRGPKGDKGDIGVSVASCVLNADYTLTITLSDGTSYTSPSIRGEKGETGAKGDPGGRYIYTDSQGNITITREGD